jgi:sugar phosphate isomerase/epimerase
MLSGITFSTLACPAWSVPSVIANARAFGYDGVEWRGGEAGHIKPQASAAERKDLRDRMRDANLFSAALTSYTAFVSPDAEQRAANVTMLKDYIDLAAEIEAKNVRVFLGELGPHQTMDEVYPRVVECLKQCGEHAENAGVGLAVEHHDSFVNTSSIVPVLSRLPAVVGAVWDVANSYSVGQAPDEGLRDLENRILHVHVKDGVGQHDKWQLTNVGEGKVPLRRALELLRAQNYAGALSVEWEYAWHPELEPPERALPHSLRVVRQLVQEVYALQGAGE